MEQYMQLLEGGLEEVENVDIDIEQVEQGTKVIITNRDGQEKEATILNGKDGVDGQDGFNGVGLNYNWNGTSLGVKREDEQNYQYVNLKGDMGSSGQDGKDGKSIVDYIDSTVTNIFNQDNSVVKQYINTTITGDMSDYLKTSELGSEINNLGSLPNINVNGLFILFSFVHTLSYFSYFFVSCENI